MAALQNLVKIMSLYYQYMETYMGPALFAVSILCNLNLLLVAGLIIFNCYFVILWVFFFNSILCSPDYLSMDVRACYLFL